MKNHKNTLLRFKIRDYFGSYSNLAKNLNINRQSVYNWGLRGLPPAKALLINKMIKNKYTVDELIENW